LCDEIDINDAPLRIECDKSIVHVLDNGAGGDGHQVHDAVAEDAPRDENPVYCEGDGRGVNVIRGEMQDVEEISEPCETGCYEQEDDLPPVERGRASQRDDKPYRRENENTVDIGDIDPPPDARRKGERIERRPLRKRRRTPEKLMILIRPCENQRDGWDEVERRGVSRRNPSSLSRVNQCQKEPRGYKSKDADVFDFREKQRLREGTTREFQSVEKEPDERAEHERDKPFCARVISATPSPNGERDGNESRDEDGNSVGGVMKAHKMTYSSMMIDTNSFRPVENF